MRALWKIIRTLFMAIVLSAAAGGGRAEAQATTRDLARGLARYLDVQAPVPSQAFEDGARALELIPAR